MLPLYRRFPPETTVETLCEGLGVGRSSAYAAAKELALRLEDRPRKDLGEDSVWLAERLREKDFQIEVIRYELDHSGCREAGESRTQFDPAYKSLVEDRRAHYGITLSRASELLLIPLDTLKKFSRYTQTPLPGVEPQDAPPLPLEIKELANAYLRSGKGTKSIKAFCDRNPELLKKMSLSYREVLSWFRLLGLVSFRGIFLKNTGLDKILKFKPNQIWSGDGKELRVRLNGELFKSAWQCLVDGKTTAIVGNAIADEETTENLKTSLEDGEKNTGTTPQAIVLDNRLSENLPAIQSYLDKKEIVVVKTYPGNAKSNIIEENFHVFERWVGEIEINGTTPKEIARSVMLAVVDIFTQMRGHKPRKSLSWKSANEVMNESEPATPEETAAVREKMRAFADRLKNEQATPLVSAQKKAAIQQAIDKTQPPSPEVLEKSLMNSRFTPDLILASLAILKQKQQEYPEKKFGHAYFFGILRNQADQRAVEQLNTHLGATYVHHWDTMTRLQQDDLAASLRSNPLATCTRLATDYLNMPAPAFGSLILLDLKKTFLVASRGSAELAVRLRESIANVICQSKRAAQARREALLCKVYEWENFIKISAIAADGPILSPAGHA